MKAFIFVDEKLKKAITLDCIPRSGDEFIIGEEPDVLRVRKAIYLDTNEVNIYLYKPPKNGRI
jgi:hypothetical protein